MKPIICTLRVIDPISVKSINPTKHDRVLKDYNISPGYYRVELSTKQIPRMTLGIIARFTELSTETEEILVSAGFLNHLAKKPNSPLDPKTTSAITALFTIKNKVVNNGPTKKPSLI